jgi:hypothetical protein
MSRATRRLSVRLLTGALVLSGLVAFTPAPVRAETSYHKLKKHLRQAERVSGDVAGVVVEGVAVGAGCVLLGVLEGLADDSDGSDSATAQPAKPKAAPAAPARTVSNMRPPESEHPQKK